MFKSIKLYVGGAIERQDLAGKLVDFGYKRQDAVSEEGEFSLRGGIVDIFPFTFELPIRIELEIDKILSIKSFTAYKGNYLWEHRMVIILPFSRHSSYETEFHFGGRQDAALAGKKAAISKLEPFDEKFPLEKFVDINIGDYVVHNHYGIGRFRGLEKLKYADKYKDNLVIEYDKQERLYVPVDEMHLVQKYIAFHVRRPKLHSLGGKEWLRQKNRAKKGIQKLAWELLSLQALRMSSTGFGFSLDTEWQKEFEKTFPYKETPDQIKATWEVKADMESCRPMDRLICGDVGYGKTEVAMRAAFKAVMDNKQVAYLVPTTILAEQHYENFSLRLESFPINIEMLSRFKTQGQQKEIIERLKMGRVDIVIGTHRLLSEDASFKNLGLVIIDEEQRFGVKAKEKLKTLRLTTDVLTLTATPIPRTLYMSLMGAKDFSVINTPPENRLPIKTVVVEYDEDLIRQAITKELNRKGQVFFLHNRIEDIEKLKQRISRLIPPGASLAIGHGQMNSGELEQVMADFFRGKIDILLSTMIIESGIDIPNANTIIVNNAHTFGLSDLHQLRGRVGRFERSAYAYFIIPKGELISSEAEKRLAAVEEYSHLGAGFKIAMEDLEIRGAGNLLGVEQHGFINAVGFDLYCRLLKEAVSNFKKVGILNG
jgi:transcription-repair coupling factor (superfamily II helicase)